MGPSSVGSRRTAGSPRRWWTTGVRATAGASMLAVSLALLPSAPATGRETAGPGPVGGQLLASRGTVVLAQPGVPALPTAITASSWLLADMTTGEVLAAHDPHGRYAPASTLKALTALTLIPRLNPAKGAMVSNADVAVDGSKVGLVPAHAYRIDHLFTAMLVASGNDAANALAGASGGIPYTVALMNDEAARLQANDTTARTVDGLDAPGQVSSAYDLALIGRAAMKLPEFRHYVAIRRAFVPSPIRAPIEISNHNRLLRNYPGAIGIKNGYTIAAGATLIGAATRGGRTLEVTLLHAKPQIWHEAAALLDWGFAAGDRLRPVGSLVDPVPPGGTSAAASPSAASAAPAPAADPPAVLTSSWWEAPRGRAVAGGGAGLLLVAVLVALLLRRRSRQLRYRYR